MPRLATAVAASSAATTTVSTTAATSPSSSVSSATFGTIPRNVTRLTALVAVASSPSTTASPAAESTTSTSSTAAESTATAGRTAAASLDGSAVGSGHLNGLGTAVVVVLDLELDGFVGGEASESLGSDGGLVDEEILAAVLGSDEAEPLLGVEPLDGAPQPILSVTHLLIVDLLDSLFSLKP